MLARRPCRGAFAGDLADVLGWDLPRAVRLLARCRLNGDGGGRLLPPWRQSPASGGAPDDAIGLGGRDGSGAAVVGVPAIRHVGAGCYGRAVIAVAAAGDEASTRITVIPGDDGMSLQPGLSKFLREFPLPSCRQRRFVQKWMHPFLPSLRCPLPGGGVSKYHPPSLCHAVFRVVPCVRLMRYNNGFHSATLRSTTQKPLLSRPPVMDRGSRLVGLK